MEATVSEVRSGAGAQRASGARSAATTALSMVAKVPEVRTAVLGELSGVLLDSVREPDGESVAAVTAFVASALAQAGDQLGLGGLRRIAGSGVERAFLVVLDGQQAVFAQIEPARALAAVEKLVETSIPGQG
jgi:predicted regulator of Ras-like GTPase activity (Roadblock/LC7/MglB family)